MAFGDGDLVEGKGYTTEEERQLLVSNCTDACNYEYLELKPDGIPQVRTSVSEINNWSESFGALFQDWNNCTFYHGDCKYTFSYNYFIPIQGPDSIILHLTEDEGEKQRCPPPPNFIGIIFRQDTNTFLIHPTFNSQKLHASIFSLA